MSLRPPLLTPSRKRASLANYILVRYLASLLLVSMLTVMSIYWVLRSTQTTAIELSQEATEEFLVQSVQYEVRNYQFESLQLSLSAFRDALEFKRIDVVGPYGKPIAEAGDVAANNIPNSTIPITSDDGAHFGAIRIWYSDLHNSWAQSNEAARSTRVAVSVLFFLIIAVGYSIIFYVLIRRHLNEPLAELAEHMNKSQSELIQKETGRQKQPRPIPAKLAQFEETRALGHSYQNLERRWLNADRQRNLALTKERHQRSTLLEVLGLAKITVAFIDEEEKLHFLGTAINDDIKKLLTESHLDEELILQHANSRGWSAQDTVFQAHEKSPATGYARFVELEDESGQKWSLHSVKIDHRKAVILREVTQERTLEQALTRSEKLKAIGTLSSSIAHDFNNIISTILVNLELIRSMINNQEEVPDDLFEGIEQSASGIAHRIGGIRRLALEQDTHLEAVDQAQRLKELELFIAPTMGADIHIKLDIRDESFVKCDGSEFESSIINLLVNAKQAMDGRGQITLRTRPATKGELVHMEQDNRPYLAIDVIDTGPGVAVDIANLIFDPFYSTRKLTDGTGLGLAQVQAFAMRAGGHVYLNRRHRPKGACFTLILPIAQQPIAIKSSRSILKSDQQCALNVYVLDDNFALAKTTSILLSRYGFDAEPFETLTDLREAAEHKPLTGILLSDVHMPDCNFKDVMQFSQNQGQDLKLAFYSGNEESLLSIKKLYPQNPTILKPFQTRELAQFLQNISGQSTSKEPPQRVKPTLRHNKEHLH